MSNKRQETVADIVAEMRKDIAEGTVGIWSDFGGEIARSYADRIEAAWMREALEDARRFVSASAQRTDRDLLIMDEKRGAYVLTPKETLIKIDDVLSAPPRNCDIGTVEEQVERYEKFCYAHRSREKGCGDCPLCDIPCCEFAWMQLPYGEGGAK